jgi:hypothetical protein
MKTLVHLPKHPAQVPEVTLIGTTAPCCTVVLIPVKLLYWAQTLPLTLLIVLKTTALHSESADGWCRKDWIH